MKIFGPIPSRRLGRSLGINNIPYKKCSYSCLYCQVGKTYKKTINRASYYNPEEISKELVNKIVALKVTDDKVDHLSIVPDGEPTLDINLGKLVNEINSFGIRTALFTNGSLLWDDEVKDDLSKLDLVSIKIDSVDEDIWRQMNQPLAGLDLKLILNGIHEFVKNYHGRIITETMFLKGMNDSRYSIDSTAEFISSLNIEHSYLALPVRPPAAFDTSAASMSVIDLALDMFGGKNIPASSLLLDTAKDFSYTGDFPAELLSITRVHPMNKNALERYLNKANQNWNVIEELVEEKKLTEIEYNGMLYYQSNCMSQSG